MEITSQNWYYYSSWWFTKTIPEYTLRLGCIAYSDWSDGNKRLEKLDFTENIDPFKKWIGQLKDEGGILSLLKNNNKILYN